MLLIKNDLVCEIMLGQILVFNLSKLFFDNILHFVQRLAADQNEVHLVSGIVL